MIVAIIALFIPRITLFFIWALTDWLSVAFETTVWPLLGFIFMPYTTLAYMGAGLNGGLDGGWLVLFIIAIIADLSSLGGSA